MTKSTITRERLEQLADNNTICKVSWDERIELAKIALAAMGSETAIADCAPEVYEKGVSVCLVAIPKETAEVICQNITAATGCKVDWHYFGGRVHIKALRESSQPAPLVPDGYVMVPMRLTAENGAKGALSGEFSETKFVNCPECFGDDECETCDGSGKIEITVPVTWTTIKAIWVKGVEHFAATAQEND
ncbi:TPA: hypothetical protein L9T70_004027 [Klebsiella pneumoniae]|nr:hypothetical protein [Klebsiella pneumoniae]MDQ5149962.1 hypothetical protein [Klebsiella pneumoniae]MDQ5155617.1 hypothetical protein [Klebsiella pneumoniae]MDQ5171577.1 hypothetical protein [Klebsiella pneumoniae]MDQ5176966.1 hypothetical protein [Klebsiella pneumoniae]